MELVVGSGLPSGDHLEAVPATHGDALFVAGAVWVCRVKARHGGNNLWRHHVSQAIRVAYHRQHLRGRNCAALLVTPKAYLFRDIPAGIG